MAMALALALALAGRYCSPSPALPRGAYVEGQGRNLELELSGRGVP